MSDLLTRLRAAANNEALGIGEAWAALDVAVDEIERLGECLTGNEAAFAQIVAERDEARALLRECRTAFDHLLGGWRETARLTWDMEHDLLLARLDALLGAPDA